MHIARPLQIQDGSVDPARQMRAFVEVSGATRICMVLGQQRAHHRQVLGQSVQSAALYRLGVAVHEIQNGLKFRIVHRLAFGPGL